jgi:hypothetical protein
LDFTDHYNKQLNKCFILVEWHYHSKLAGPGGSSWTNDMELRDVYENFEYGEFGENHYTYLNQSPSNNDEVIRCEVFGAKCKSGEEFNNLVRPYVNE